MGVRVLPAQQTGAAGLGRVAWRGLEEGGEALDLLALLHHLALQLVAAV